MQLQADTDRLKSQTDQLHSEIDSLKAENSKLKAAQDQVSGELAQKINAKQQEIKALRDQLAPLVNGGTRNYSLQDDQSRLQLLKDQMASINSQIKGLQTQKAERARSARGDAEADRKNQQSLKNQNLQLIDEKIAEQKAAIQATQQNINNLKLSKPFDFQDQYLNMQNQLVNQRAQLEEFNRDKAQIKATPIQVSSGSVNNDDLDQQINALQNQSRDLNASINQIQSESKNLAVAQSAELKTIQQLQSQIQAKENELKDLQGVAH
jgi:chromosome segregation ATPase